MAMNIFHSQPKKIPRVLAAFRTDAILDGDAPLNEEIKTYGFGSSLVYTTGDFRLFWAMMIRGKKDESKLLPVIGTEDPTPDGLMELSYLDNYVRGQIPIGIEGIVEKNGRGYCMNASKVYPLNPEEATRLQS